MSGQGNPSPIPLNSPPETKPKKRGGLAYGSPSPGKKLDYRLWRVERGNVMLRAGNAVTQGQPTGNGALFGRANTDALSSSGQLDPTKPGLLTRGSVPPSISSPNFTFTANSGTQLVITWSDYAIRRADGTATLLPAGRMQIDNLTPSAKYYFFPFWAEAATTIGWVNGGSGTPCIAFTGLLALNVQTQNLVGNVSLGTVGFTMPASGAASGSSGGFTTTGSLGAAVGGGGSTGCPLSGAPVNLYGKPEWWKKTVKPCEDFIEIVTESGRRGTFSRNDRRYCRRGLLPLFQWEVGDWALTEDGEEVVTSIALVHFPGATIDSYEATKGHIYSAWGFIGHNVKLPLSLT